MTGMVDGGPARPPLVRPQQGRIVAGVAAGLSAHLGWPVRAVRVGLVVLAGLGGVGALLYAWLWALVPSRETALDVGSAGSVPGRPVPGSPVPGRRADAVRTSSEDLLLGGVLLLAGLLLLAARLGVDVRPGLTLPVLVVAAGAVLAYSQLDEVERSRWAGRASGSTRAALVRVAAGTALVLVGVLLVVVQRTDLADAGRVLVAALSVLAGAGIVLAPWGVRLWRDLDAERAARVREAERGEIAAHLHDSVLQTLTLIQRHSGDPGEVARLARAQERDLRDWLYGPRTGPGGDSVAAQLQAVGAEVEDVHGVPVEVVAVGDRALDERSRALVGAVREAVVNAARHAGGPVQVYLEAGPDTTEAFVRDRGPGFDPAGVPDDRLGIRESILGRMQRAGGSATVRARPGEGTEVRLVLPAAAPAVPAVPTGPPEGP
jgi:signal transduction histidine kinase/phage shock protein PspC (stress-responsive transcriptional regulator)